VLVLGNRTQHELYNPATNTWARTADSPAIISPGHTATLRTRNGVPEVVIVGATWVNGSPQPTAYRYLGNTNQWASSAQVPTVPRKGHQAVLLANGAIRIVGGVDFRDGAAVSTVERFNTNNAWFTEPAMLKPRREFQASLVGASDPMLASGGWLAPTDGGTPVRQQTELYSGCVTTNCAVQNAQCSTVPDGCGGALTCGTCPSDTYCNTETRQCIPLCAPLSQASACPGQCGSVSNGCGGTVDCGPCPACALGTVWCCQACNQAQNCDHLC
jgi:hypothetical protein